MKLVLSIINTEDAHSVSTALTNSGFQVTKLSTTGGFLRTGNVTFLTGVEDSKVKEVIKIIKQKSNKRSKTVPALTSSVGDSSHLCSAIPFRVNVGGAIIFVLNVEDFQKI